MSGVYIHGMEMPTSCCGCVFSAYTPTGKIPYCKRTKKDLVADVYFNKRDYDCPLIEVPPHGRLIDSDVLGTPWTIEEDTLWRGRIETEVYLASTIYDAPTIIPADKE